MAPDLVTAQAARRLFLQGQGLLQDPARRATPAAVHRLVERMGFVQVDTINVVARAHDHILHTRFDDYRPAMLAKLLERDRKLFEHWTHDASVVPIRWYPEWKVRFDRYRARGHSPNSWWSERMGGDPERVIAHVLERITNEGPLMSRDFEHEPGEISAWWGWKPAKAGLEYLWRSGEIAVAARRNFHKVYDLSSRVLGPVCDAPRPDPDAHRDWACRAALERLGVATVAEMASFLRAIAPDDARAWCREAEDAGAIAPVLVESADGSPPQRAYAVPGWSRRVARAPAPPDRIRLLSPFDPLIRDRRRALRRFGFDYRFEAFVPAAKRRYGYYVMPMMEGERLVGRLDPKLHRDRGELVIQGLWWEPGVRPTRDRRRRLGAAVERLAELVGADRIVRDDLP